MTRAELVAEVRRLADETAGLAADVRRRDTALELLGQVRDFGHRLPPGLAADIRRVVDDMVATRRHEAQAGPHSPAAGTSSAGDGAGSASPAAPSTETRQAAQDGQSGSGGDATEGVPAHQPTPQAGDVWRYLGNDPFTGIGAVARVTAVGHLDREGRPLVRAEVEHSSDGRGIEGRRVANWVKWWTLVERDGRPWPPAQEPEPVAVEPATDEQIEAWSKRLLPTGSAHAAIDALVARVRQEHAALLQTNGWLRDAERERDEAVDRTYAAVDRANAAEAALARVERVTGLERAVVEAAKWHVDHAPHAHPGHTGLDDAVRALRDAQEAGS